MPTSGATYICHFGHVRPGSRLGSIALASRLGRDMRSGGQVDGPTRPAPPLVPGRVASAQSPNPLVAPSFALQRLPTRVSQAIAAGVSQGTRSSNVLPRTVAGLAHCVPRTTPRYPCAPCCQNSLPHGHTLQNRFWLGKPIAPWICPMTCSSAMLAAARQVLSQRSPQVCLQNYRLATA